MREYAELGHMRLLGSSERGEVLGATNYLCHHFVVNDSSTTTKLRVVFDGSSTTSTGVSLNSTMRVGATLQDDLYDLLLRFRTHAVVLKADMTKMFRQFRLKEEDAKYHRILWRENSDHEVKEYQLTTITYGTAYAPNLSTRCIQQLGEDCAVEYPLASKVLLRDTYIDDTLSGFTTASEAMKAFHQLNAAVKTAGLELRKWVSNDKTVMASIPEELRETSQLIFDDNELVKALGVQWQPSSDEFRFKAVSFEENGKINSRLTKRSLLSDLARVFDPLGLISCVILRGKLLLQELWKLPISWDDQVPENVQLRWEEYKQDLCRLQEIRIPRRVTVNGAERMELHGFSDSSEIGFGGIVYLRSIMPNGAVEVRFITSKTRVAPVRQVTLPRLELCAAVLVAELIVHVREVLQLDAEMHLWSDSTITLTWIASPPRRWKTYVANRVANIQELTKIESWRHVAGTDNPADLASRGCSVDELKDCDLWWRGPGWLGEPVLPEFPAESTALEGDLEERQVPEVVNIVQIEEGKITNLSDLTKLKRLTAWYLRFVRRKYQHGTKSGSLTAAELQAGLLYWVRSTQQQYFKDEFHSLKKDSHVSKKSKLKGLYPYVDKIGILRVSGRLKNAEIPEGAAHQIIIPGNSHLAMLIARHYHTRCLHGGFQVTWSTIQAEYWILGGRNLVRHLVRSCVKCRRYRASAAQQLMGDLPAPRVQPSRPFMHTGVDYAGPFMLKDVVGRVPKTYKGYLCLFVCLATKAIHLEGVTSHSTEAFLAALRRFVSRRGLCAHVYSDCGTNFVGAEKELQAFIQSAKGDVLQRELVARGITWHFNPPAAPHFGGLWEAGVKSVKHHLRRVMGNSMLTFECFTTVLNQVEAVLNSRPLFAMSADPGDLQPLTPGHFLIGCPLLAAPDADWVDVPSNRLSQYQRLQQQLQQFWGRWCKEYLNTLQQRNKWMWESENVRVGDLVLLVEETPPGTWRLGRIINVHPGDDGKVRVATVKTASSTFKRAIAKLIPLVQNEDK